MPLTTEIAIRQHVRKKMLTEIKKIIAENHRKTRLIVENRVDDPIEIDIKSTKGKQLIKNQEKTAAEMEKLIEDHGDELAIANMLLVARKDMGPLLNKMLGLTTFPVNYEELMDLYQLVYGLIDADNSKRLRNIKIIMALYGDQNENIGEFLGGMINPLDPLNWIGVVLAIPTGGLSLALTTAGKQFGVTFMRNMFRNGLRATASTAKNLVRKAGSKELGDQAMATSLAATSRQAGRASRSGIAGSADLADDAFDATGATDAAAGVFQSEIGKQKTKRTGILAYFGEGVPLTAAGKQAIQNAMLELTQLGPTEFRKAVIAGLQDMPLGRALRDVNEKVAMDAIDEMTDAELNRVLRSVMKQQLADAPDDVARRSLESVITILSSNPEVKFSMQKYLRSTYRRAGALENTRIAIVSSIPGGTAVGSFIGKVLGKGYKGFSFIPGVMTDIVRKSPAERLSLLEKVLGPSAVGNIDKTRRLILSGFDTVSSSADSLVRRGAPTPPALNSRSGAGSAAFQRVTGETLSQADGAARNKYIREVAAEQNQIIAAGVDPARELRRLDLNRLQNLNLEDVIKVTDDLVEIDVATLKQAGVPNSFFDPKLIQNGKITYRKSASESASASTTQKFSVSGNTNEFSVGDKFTGADAHQYFEGAFGGLKEQADALKKVLGDVRSKTANLDGTLDDLADQLAEAGADKLDKSLRRHIIGTYIFAVNPAMDVLDYTVDETASALNGADRYETMNKEAVREVESKREELAELDKKAQKAQRDFFAQLNDISGTTIEDLEKADLERRKQERSKLNRSVTSKAAGDLQKDIDDYVQQQEDEFVGRKNLKGEELDSGNLGWWLGSLNSFDRYLKLWTNYGSEVQRLARYYTRPSWMKEMGTDIQRINFVDLTIPIVGYTIYTNPETYAGIQTTSTQRDEIATNLGRVLKKIAAGKITSKEEAKKELVQCKGISKGYYYKWEKFLEEGKKEPEITSIDYTMIDKAEQIFTTVTNLEETRMDSRKLLTQKSKKVSLSEEQIRRIIRKNLKKKEILTENTITTNNVSEIVKNSVGPALDDSLENDIEQSVIKILNYPIDNTDNKGSFFFAAHTSRPLIFPSFTHEPGLKTIWYNEDSVANESPGGLMLTQRNYYAARLSGRGLSLAQPSSEKKALHVHIAICGIPKEKFINGSYTLTSIRPLQTKSYRADQLWSGDSWLGNSTHNNLKSYNHTKDGVFLYNDIMPIDNHTGNFSDRGGRIYMINDGALNKMQPPPHKYTASRHAMGMDGASVQNQNLIEFYWFEQGVSKDTLEVNYQKNDAEMQELGITDHFDESNIGVCGRNGSERLGGLYSEILDRTSVFLSSGKVGTLMNTQAFNEKVNSFIQEKENELENTSGLVLFALCVVNNRSEFSINKNVFQNTMSADSFVSDSINNCGLANKSQFANRLIRDSAETSLYTGGSVIHDVHYAGGGKLGKAGKGQVACLFSNNPIIDRINASVLNGKTADDIKEPSSIVDTSGAGADEDQEEKADKQSANKIRQKVKNYVDSQKSAGAQIVDGTVDADARGNTFIAEKSIAYYIYLYDLEKKVKKTEYFKGMWPGAYGKGDFIDLDWSDFPTGEHTNFRNIIIDHAYKKGVGIFKTYKNDMVPLSQLIAKSTAGWTSTDGEGLGDYLKTIPGLEAYNPDNDDGSLFSYALFLMDLVNDKRKPSKSPLKENRNFRTRPTKRKRVKTSRAFNKKR